MPDILNMNAAILIPIVAILLVTPTCVVFYFSHRLTSQETLICNIVMFMQLVLALFVAALAFIGSLATDMLLDISGALYKKR